MKLSHLTQTSPRGFLRLGLRFPILLYKAHLGWMLADRFLMLTHIGRKSGKPHQAVVEVVRHDRKQGIFTIASGWGEKSDWFQNIMAHPEVKVHAGTRRFTAIATRLTENEAKTALRDYASHHPFAFKELAGLMIGVHSGDPEEMIDTMASQIPLVDLRQKGS